MIVHVKVWNCVCVCRHISIKIDIVLFERFEIPRYQYKQKKERYECYLYDHDVVQYNGNNECVWEKDWITDWLTRQLYGSGPTLYDVAFRLFCKHGWHSSATRRMASRASKNLLGSIQLCSLFLFLSISLPFISTLSSLSLSCSSTRPLSSFLFLSIVFDMFHSSVLTSVHFVHNSRSKTIPFSCWCSSSSSSSSSALYIQL